MRQGQSAATELAQLLANGANELYVLSMIARQIRLLVSAKDLRETMGTDAASIGKRLGIRHRFIVEKLLRQQARFEMAELLDIQRQIVQADQAIKTGRIDGQLALVLLAVAICHRGSEPSYQESSRPRTR